MLPVKTQQTLQPVIGGTATWRRLDGSAGESWTATITGIEDRRLKISTDSAVPAGTPVRIDKDGSLLLGEVLFCRSERTVAEMLVQIDQVIPSVPDLALLVRAIVGAARQDVAAGTPAGVPTAQPSR